MARMLRADALARLLGFAHAEAHSHGLNPKVPTDMARATSLGARHLNRSARRALGERGDGRHHPLANARTIPGRRGYA